MSARPCIPPSRPHALRQPQAGLLSLRHAWILGSIAVSLLLAIKLLPPRSPGPAADATAAAPAGATGQPREVDFGFVELEPVLPTPIASFKKGGGMLLYAGDELRYEVLGDQPLPEIELRIGDTTQLLPGPNGTVKVAGPAGTALKASLAAKGSRHSLPGGAPPRVSVKVQVFSITRPA